MDEDSIHLAVKFYSELYGVPLPEYQVEFLKFYNEHTNGLKEYIHTKAMEEFRGL